MYDEIKEILTEINKIIDNTSYNEEFTYFQVSHISKLLDYIINLHVEINKLTTESTEWESKYYDLLNILKGSDK